MREEQNNQLTSSRKVVIRDINALLQTAPISRIKTLRDDQGRSKNVGQVLPDNKGCSLRPLRSLAHSATSSAPLAGEVRRSRVGGLLKNIATTSEKVKARMRGCSLFSLINPSPALRASSPARGEENVANGFTLIELLVVVLIIGILTATALPQYQFAVLKSRFVQAKLMVIELARAEELCYLTNGSYSPSIANLDIDFPTTDTESQAITSNTRTFTWGKCWVAAGDEYGDRAACNLNEGINLYKYLEHATVYEHGKFMCRATNADLNSSQNKLCKQISGRSSPNGDSDWIYSY